MSYHEIEEDKNKDEDKKKYSLKTKTDRNYVGRKRKQIIIKKNKKKHMTMKTERDRK